MSSKKRGPSDKVAMLLHLIAGGYLAYLGWDIVIGLNEVKARGDQTLFISSVIFGVLFIVSGLYFLGYAAREYFYLQNRSKDLQNRGKEEKGQQKEEATDTELEQHEDKETGE